MLDKIGLGPAMNVGLSWNVRATPRTPEKKAFDEAVEKWEKQRKRGEKHNAGKKKAGRRRAQPLSRTLRAFVAWKGQ
jgi:hypothetical protein